MVRELSQRGCGGRPVKDVFKAVLISVLTSLIIGTAVGVGKLVLELHELRYDVDRLYSEVSDLAAKE